MRVSRGGPLSVGWLTSAEGLAAQGPAGTASPCDSTVQQGEMEGKK